jgi:uroporphyrin-III C-methyltransferase/precorrin-2 dehydrogenase/sirohydrochlorin ferrochelatase
VLAGQTGDALEATLDAIQPQSVTLVSMMGLAHRGELAARLMAHGWSAETSAAVICGASTSGEWTWTGRLAQLESVVPPEGIPGVVVVGEVVQVRDALASARPKAGSYTEAAADEVKYGRS